MESQGKSALLPTHRVDVVEPGRSSRRGWVRCEIGENLRFEIEKLASYCLANWDTRVYDAFVVAAAVQFCDHTKTRHSAVWGRDFTLRVPVHDPDYWNSSIVSDALHHALSFLTGDRWQISFLSRKTPAMSPIQPRFDMPDGSRVIMPFSDGLDSLAVAGLMRLQYGHSLIQVQLGSKAFSERRNTHKKVPFALVPYRVSYGTNRPVESSARSRGFRFTLLSGIAAYLSGAEQVIVSESGQGALGPVLVPVGQAYEDYRNHPLFTDRMSIFLQALFNHKVVYSYPRLWHTKGETLKAFIEKCVDSDNWAQTRSCWQGQRQVSVGGKMRQCGICAACMLRRMSVHSIGESEAKENYVWEKLNVSQFKVGAATDFQNWRGELAQYHYAIAGTLHLDHLAGLLESDSNQIVLDRNAFLLSRSLSETEHAIQNKLNKMLKKHREEWRSFVKYLGPQSFVSRWAEGAE
jgi:hypothetical protein